MYKVKQEKENTPTVCDSRKTLRKVSPPTLSLTHTILYIHTFKSNRREQRRETERTNRQK